MSFTARPGNPNAQPANFVPGLGVTAHTYSKTLTASIAPAGQLTSLHNGIFNQVSITIFRAISRTLNFITTARSDV